MNRKPWELAIAFLGIAVATAIYAILARHGTPKPSSTVGYTFGILGFALMLQTEIVYTLRKKLRKFTWGRTSFWLKAHIVTGLVGPFLILLHTGWKFQGLAGTAALLLLMVVLSGFIGRYIYTATPRTIGGAIVPMNELVDAMHALDHEIDSSAKQLSVKVIPIPMPSIWLVVWLRPWFRWRIHRRIRAITHRARAHQLGNARNLERLMLRKAELELQWHSLEATRYVIALWHTFHVPLGLVMFAVAFLHVGGAVYFSWRDR